MIKPHDLLSMKDILSIFNYEHCDKRSAKGFRNSLVIAAGLAIGARTTELLMLKVSQFQREILNNKNALAYYPKVGSRVGESKNHEGGIAYVNYRRRVIPIHDIDLLDGESNIYQLINEYMSASEEANISPERFFLGTKPRRIGQTSSFLKPQPTGRNTMTSIVKKICNALGIRGEGVAKHVTTNG